MEALDSAVSLMDDLLDFASDIDEEEEGESLNTKPPFTPNPPLPDFAEEELEWLSNKDAFPAVETFVGGIPVSVLTSITGSLMTDSCRRSLKIPVKARSKHGRRRRSDLQWWPSNEKARKAKAAVGRTCAHCGAEKTPQWRAGPLGPKTLCNACGVRYKSGRLVPEYRPASSPSFRREMHSNSHRRVLEMRKQKQMTGFVEEG